MLLDAGTQTCPKNEDDDDDASSCGDDCDMQNANGVKKTASQVSLHSAKSTGFIASTSNNGEILHDLDAPIPSLDEKLNRLSWHSSMTSYIAWRLASPHVPSPGSSPASERRHCPDEDPVAV